MGRMILVLGGTRSGKSLFAEELSKGQERVAYVATALVSDDEMRRRVEMHRKRRPRSWITYEAGTKLASAIRNAAKTSEFIIVDCITLYLANPAVSGMSEEGQRAALEEIEQICSICKQIAATVVVVSNEVGMSVVPDTPSGRAFRDLQGKANQIIAKHADEVYFVIAGIAQKIK